MEEKRNVIVRLFCSGEDDRFLIMAEDDAVKATSLCRTVAAEVSVITSGRRGYMFTPSSGVTLTAEIQGNLLLPDAIVTGWNHEWSGVSSLDYVFEQWFAVTDHPLVGDEDEEIVGTINIVVRSDPNESYIEFVEGHSAMRYFGEFPCGIIEDDLNASREVNNGQ